MYLAHRPNVHSVHTKHQHSGGLMYEKKENNQVNECAWIVPAIIIRVKKIYKETRHSERPFCREVKHEQRAPDSQNTIRQIGEVKRR